MENQARVVRGRVKLWVPHNDGEIAFAFPAVKGNYKKMGAKILADKQKVPTGDYTASLVHAAYCNSNVKNEPEFENVRDIVRDNWLYVFNKDLWTSKGVYVFKDLEATGLSKPLEVAELEEMLKGGKELSWGGIRFSQDRRLGFAPKGSYVLGDHTSESLAKDGFIIASCDIEGAKKLGEASAKFRSNPYTFGVDVQEGNVPQLRVSELGECDSWLRFGGYDWGDCSDYRAFGGL